MRRRTALGLALLLVLGGLLRTGYLHTPIMDSDQAVHGLQTRHFLLGEFAVFQWGLAYMGTVQSFLTAVAFAFFGASRLVLNAVPLFLSLVLIALTYRLGREMSSEGAGLVAASLVALAPPYLAVYGAWARHGYVDSLLFGSAVLLLALRLARKPQAHAQETRLFAVLGLVGGVAWWINFLSLFYLVPAALFLLLSDWTCLRRRGPWAALAFFLLGSAPFWIFNLLHSFWSFALFERGDVAQAPRQLVGVVTEALPAILGMRDVQSGANLLPILSEAVVALYAAAFGWLVWRGLGRWSTKQGSEPGPALLLLFFAVSALLVSVSRRGEAVAAGETTRYLFPLYSALPLLLALFLARVREVSRSLFVVLLAAPLSLHLYGNLERLPLLTGEITGFRQARAQDAELFRFLKARRVTRVYAIDYWLAPRLTFDAGEEIIFAQPSGDRYPPYTRLVDAAPRVAYLFSAGASGGFQAFLAAIGATFERTAVGPYEVLHDFRPPRGVDMLASLPRTDWAAAASSGRDLAALVFDRDVDTAWYSGEAQRPGQFFQVDLGRPTRVGKVVLLPPQPSIGFPRGYRLEVSRDGRVWEEVAAVGDALWSLDWRGGQPRVEPRGRVAAVFEPREVRYVRIHQTGSHPTSWAIGELFVYGPASGGSAHPPQAAEAHLVRGRAHEVAGRIEDALAEFRQAARLDPEWDVAHARLASLYERAGIPLDGAAPPAVRAAAFEQVGLWAKAAREYEGEIRRIAHHQHHTDLWRRLLRAYREAAARGDTGEEEKARRVEEGLAREFSPPVPAVASFGDEIRFLGYRLEPRAVLPGRTFRITYYWQALRRGRTDYTVFVHFVRDGRVRFQQDHAPLDGAYPTSLWQAGEVVRETFEVLAPEHLEAGSYEIGLGVWDPNTGRRLGVTDTSLAHTKDRVAVGRVTVDTRS